MARTPATFLLLLLLVSSGLHVSCGCPDSCACRAPSLLNCSSAGLTSAPRPIRASVAQLDLSHNLLRAVAFDGPRPNLRDVWLGDNGVERLSLCVGGETGRTRRGRACESWAPALQLLSVERNRLQALPQGLESSRSLQVLQLSYNRISALRPGDLRHLQQLEELHLHHNLIRSLHPQTFQGLTRLRVLDLSFNMLTSLHPSTYLSLRHVGAEVALGGNRWRCDCGARGLRRRMSYDGSRGLRAWSLVCASPAALAGRDLLRLEDHDLDCSGADGGAELHRDVTVRRGSEILLTCARQDLSWWTPSGEASVSQPQAGLLISDFQETDTGLYVCVSEKLEVVSVFDLQISEVGESRRKARSLPGISRQMIPRETPDSSDRGRNQLIRATQSELDLAVCLSVFITFVVSFVLGVLARPCVDVLLRRFTREKSSATTSVSAVEQRQYDNEAFCHSEEPVFTGPHRERRVTFSTIDLTEEGHVKYYDTVNAGNQERVNDDAVIECEPAEAERDTNAAGGSGSKISVRESGAEESQMDLSGRTHEKEFEHIPDSVERRGSVSSRSDSSRSDKVVNSTQTSRKREEDSVQQRADYSTAAEEDVVHISLEGPSGLGFPTEPFADWSPHAKDTNLSDPGLWQENEEQFEFSDSAQSTSARSSTVRGSFNDSRLVSTLNKQKWVDSSNSSSNVSEDERTQNTVNKVAEDLERNLRKDGNFEQRILDDDAIGPSVQFNQGDYRPAVRPGESFSSLSSDGKGFTVKKGRVPSLVATSHGESLNTSAEASSPAAHRSSSSSESDAEHKHDLTKPIKRRAPQPPTHSDSRVEGENKTMNHMQKRGATSAKGLQIGVSQTGRHDPDTRWPVLDLEHIPHIKRRLDIKGPSHDSSSIKTRDETTRYTKRPVKMKTAGPPVLVSQTGSHNPDSRWPVLDLEHIPHIKRRLDIKGPSPDSSSSSDSDQIKKPAQGNLSMAKLPSEVSQTVSYDQQTKWPVLDLGATTRIKRRLDIKGPSPDSTSSSDSEDETTCYTEKPGNVGIVGPSVLVSQTGSHNADSRWPVLDLEQIPHIKRRLYIKGPSPDSSSSSHSDQIKKPAEGNLSMAKLPSEVSQTVSYDQQTKWPVLDLGATTRIKRRLDIKGPSPDSTSSSDSEDETTCYTEKPGNVGIVGPSVLVSQTGSHNADSRWPVLDLEHIPHIKRRLDIKGPSPDSSSSSDSDQIKKPAQGNLSMAKLPSEVSQTVSYDQQTKCPVLDLGATTRIKRRLDIKGPSPDSTSSSDSEDETTCYTEKPGNVEIVGPSVLVSQTGSHNADSRWPVLDLEQIPHIKRRLYIKPRSPTPDSLSSGGGMNKMSSRRSSSSSDEQEGNVKNVRYHQTTVDPDGRWPDPELRSVFHVKKRLDIKARSPPPPESSSSSDHESEARCTNVEKQRTYVGITGYQSDRLSGTKKRLNIKGPSQPMDSESISSGEDENAKGLELSSVLKATKKEVTILPNTQVISTSRSPKTDNSIQLEKYTVITEEVGDKTSVNISATPEINPELQSRWATMNLGVSRFRKRLDITANTREPPSLSLLAPPDSPSSSSSGTESTSNRTQGNGKGAGVQGIIYKESTIIPEDKPGKVSLGLKGRDHSGDAVQGTEKSTKDYNRPTTERKPDTLLTDFSIPHVKRYLDIKVNEKVPPLEQLPDSFSSSSENEDASTKPVGEGWRKEASQHPTSLYSTQAVTVKPSQTELGRTKDEAELDRKLDSVRPELSLANIPRVRRALDIRAQRESRSSENETTSLSVPNLSLGVPRVKRRLNVKGPLPSSSSESESDTNQSRSASNMSGMTDNDSLIAYKRVIMKTSPLPGWSSSQSGQRETERVEQESPSFAPKRVPRVGFDNVVDGRTGRPIGGADIPTEIRWTSIGRQMPDLSVPSPTGRSSPVARDVSLSPGRGFEKLDAPKARNERRGLGALKAMSSDRRKWDATEGNWASVAAPRSDDTRFENHRSAGEVESSTSRETDLLYGIPRYRRHDLGGTGPPREAPPLIPTTQSPP
uniref:Immunoglobulin domain-containing protein n=1 Tax=Gasterosteus aculeatus aculeatus TaxID=481459 RepID=A0AAQ4Q6T8_GASAC